MEKGYLTSRNAFCILFLMTMGTRLVIGLPFNARQDSWLSLILAFAMALPITLIYARLLKLCPEKNLFEMCYGAFGKIGGAVVTVILVWYAIHLSAMIIQNYAQFFRIIALDETPIILIILGIVMVAFYILQGGVRLLGKWSVIVLSIFIALFLLTFLTTVREYDFNNLFPVFENDFSHIFAGSVSILAFPFCETLLFLALGDSIKKKSGSYKIYILSLIVSTVVLLLIFFKDLLVLGRNAMDEAFFPSYATARVARLSVFIERIESVISYYYLLAGITKLVVCMYAAVKGFAKLFGIKKEKNLNMPVTLLVFALASIIYKNALDMFNYSEKNPYYALPIQIIIPVALWITLEIKNKRSKNKDKIADAERSKQDEDEADVTEGIPSPSMSSRL